MRGLFPLFPALSPKEAFQAQEALWQLLSRQARLYAPESTSLSAETARMLAESILLTLEADSAPRVLLTSKLTERFQQGQQRLAQKAAAVYPLCQSLLSSLPEVENRSLTDTLRSLCTFPAHYDWRFFAQTIPSDIDYQLSQPVPDTLQGVDYVLEWLRRLGLEIDFLNRFEPSLLRALLERSCPDYRGLLINLYEPAAVNALGLALLKEDPHFLSVSLPQRRRLERLLSAPPIGPTLQSAAKALCSALNITSRQTGRYLQETAQTLLPRLQAALSAGTLAHIFLEF